MNKRFVAVLLVAVMMLTACGKKQNDTKETTVVETEAVTETTVMIETHPGTGVNPFGDPNTVFESMAQEETDAEEVIGTEASDQVYENADDENQTEEKEPVETTKPQPETPNAEDAEQTDYEKYLNMTGDEQTAFIESFDSVEAFFEWLNTAKAEYEANNPGIVVDGGVIDLEEITESK